MLGTTISHYQILEKLGEGGMGVVYKARDTRLNRLVALKVLPPDKVADAARRRRFVQEAQAASALNHPNIVTIYDIGEADGNSYIAMEYVAGKTLDALIPAQGLPLGQTLKYAVQAADALAKAHAGGIVHRDLKPGNVMVSGEGRVKLLDFGLAKLTEVAAESDELAPTLTMSAPRTQEGTVLGTAAYMSPEQAEAKRVDARSDIFSFGVVLYEMVTGQRAFRAQSQMATMAAVLNKEPEPLPPDTPHDLEKVISRCLRKDPERRFQSMADVKVALEELQEESRSSTIAPASAGSLAGAMNRRKLGVAVAVLLLAGAALVYYAFVAGRGGGAIDSLAVLPFTNVSGNPDTEYLSDGLTESIIFNLSRLKRLKVLPGSAVFRLKDRDKDPQALGRELGVRAVLAGRIVQRGDDLSVSAELIEVAENRLLWGQQYNRKMSDALSLQREISKEISDRLHLRPSGEEEQLVTRSYTDKNEAYQLYLKGGYHYNKYTEDGFRKSIEYFEQAIEKEPDYALAWSALSGAYGSLRFFGYLSPEETVPKQKAALAKALELDNTLAEAHLSLAGLKHYYEWDFSGAEQEYKRALELNPNLARAHAQYGLLLAVLEQADEAVAEGQRALELEPLSLVQNLNVGWIYWAVGQFDRTREQGRKLIEMEPNFFGGHSLLEAEAKVKGRYEESASRLEKALELGAGTHELSALGAGYAVMGRRDKAEEILSRLLKLRTQRPIPLLHIARVYVDLGEMDRAFEWLEKAYQQREGQLIYLKLEARWMAPALRRDPRLPDLLRRIGLPP